MPLDFEELDYRETALGELILRRRHEPAVAGSIVYEIKLNDDFLMSSLFTAGERALAELGLAALPGGEADVVVGGLGLGYTAAAVLAHDRVRSLLVVEALGEVIEWHQRGLVPLGRSLTGDPRCRFIEADFFALAARAMGGFDPGAPGRRFDAVLLDIDHSPRHWLQPQNSGFYGTQGLRDLCTHLRPGGVFALWSNDPPDPTFRAVLDRVFAASELHVVEFANPYRGGKSTCSVYVARTGRME